MSRLVDIRLARPEERIQYRAICQTVFHNTSPQDMRAKLAGELEYEHKDDNPLIAAFDESGKMLSAMTIIPYTILMHGKEVPMAGVAGVATKPEARCRGLVRQIYHKAYQVMLESNQIYSFLYPFSFEYYRKLGYEHCNPLKHSKIPTTKLMTYPYPAQVKAFEPGDDISPYMKVYELFTKNRNLAVVRSKKTWEHMLNRDPYQRLQFSFLFGPAESPTAYVLYDSKLSKDERSLFVVELCYASPEGLFDALGFLGRLSPEIDHMHWDVPTGLDIHCLCCNLLEVEPSIIPKGMGRVVDVLAALNGTAAPGGSGSCCIKVTDTFLTDNSGFYTVEWGSGQLSAKRADSCLDKSVDMETSVEGLMQLLCGYVTPNEAAFRRDTKLFGQKNLLCDLFPRNDIYIMERF